MRSRIPGRQFTQHEADLIMAAIDADRARSRQRKLVIGAVIVFIGALVAANLLVAWLGPWALPFTAFFLIGFDFTARDILHEAWHGRGLALRMGALIATGAVIAYLLNREAGPIGLASFAAFFLAQGSDTLVYGALHRRSWLARANISNTVAALVDSVVFTLVAFHTWMPLLVLTQWAIKASGGLAWSFIIRHLRNRYPLLKGTPHVPYNHADARTVWPRE